VILSLASSCLGEYNHVYFQTKVKVHFEGLWSLEIDFPQEGDEAKTYMKGDYELD